VVDRTRTALCSTSHGDHERAAWASLHVTHVAAFAHMRSVGLTGVGDAGCLGWVIALYRELADHGLLTVRIYAMIRETGADFDALSMTGPWDRAAVRVHPMNSYAATLNVRPLRVNIAIGVPRISSRRLRGVGAPCSGIFLSHDRAD